MSVSAKDESVQLHSFRLREVLRNDQEKRVICLHLDQYSEDGQDVKAEAVLIAQKTPFSEQTICSLLSAQSKLSTIVKNDIYVNCEITLPPEINALKGTLIYPATSKHVDKYREEDFEMVAESGDDYRNVTLRYLIDHQNQFSVKWIDNLLEHKAEAERIIFEDPDPINGFILAPDLKWDGVAVERLYASAIVRRKDLKSIRSLTDDHLPLLKSIYQKSCRAIKEKYGVDANHLRVFFHYQPSYYHLHVHFMHMKGEQIGVFIGQAHLLLDVIDNIEMMPTYYQQKQLYFTLKKNNPLLEALKGSAEQKSMKNTV